MCLFIRVGISRRPTATQQSNMNVIRMLVMFVQSYSGISSVRKANLSLSSLWHDTILDYIEFQMTDKTRVFCV